MGTEIANNGMVNGGSRIRTVANCQAGQPSMYMPIKALNTFSRDWKIQARVASKSEKRMTRNGGSLLKIELVDMYGT